MTVRDLVALDLSSATRVADAVRREWDNGNAILVVDQRLPRSAKQSLVDVLGVHVVLDDNNRTNLSRKTAPMLDGDALVIATSGTSGDPKGVVHTHFGLRSASLASSAALRCGAESHWLACLPLSHIGGFGVLTRAWHTGATLTIHDGFDASLAATTGATHVSLVATALLRVDASTFERILLGGARPPSVIPPNTTVTYGLTESCGGVVYDRRPIPGVSVSIADDGEVLLKGPMMMSRYRNDDVSSAIDGDGWLHTNDVGRIVDNLLEVDGRRGDMIVTGGEKVWPDAVERSLLGHKAISECAVAGVDDPEWGQRVTSWVVVRADEKISLEEIREHVARDLPRYCAPRQLVLVDSLPRTSLGKVVRRILVEQLASNG